MTATALASVSLDDKYTLDSGRIYLTGIQALVRLPLMQRQRDDAAGLNTAGFISGYRGSPLGGYDQALWRRASSSQQQQHRVPARASTRTWPPPRSGAASRSACSPAPSTTACSASGTARARASTAPATCSSTPTSPAPRQYGGVLALAGDDHACKSSTLPHQSEHAFIDADDPGAEPGRRPGDPGSRPLWLGDVALFRLLGRLQDASPRRSTARPRSTSTRTGSRSCCPRISRCRRAASTSAGPTRRWTRKRGCMRDKLLRRARLRPRQPARPHGLSTAPRPRFGIVTTGKSYLDVRQALDDLGIDEALAAELGICDLQGRHALAAGAARACAPSPRASTR